jgi:hypothetical protein
MQMCGLESQFELTCPLLGRLATVWSVYWLSYAALIATETVSCYSYRKAVGLVMWKRRTVVKKTVALTDAYMCS